MGQFGVVFFLTPSNDSGLCVRFVGSLHGRVDQFAASNIQKLLCRFEVDYKHLEDSVGSFTPGWNSSNIAI